jgi:hypothetical protein
MEHAMTAPLHTTKVAEFRSASHATLSGLIRVPSVHATGSPNFKTSHGFQGLDLILSVGQSRENCPGRRCMGCAVREWAYRFGGMPTRPFILVRLKSKLCHAPLAWLWVCPPREMPLASLPWVEIMAQSGAARWPLPGYFPQEMFVIPSVI